MKNIEIKLNAHEVKQIKAAIKKSYGNTEIFAKHLHIREEVLEKYFIAGIPVKTMCCIIERLSLPDFKIIYDTVISLKKIITDELGMTIAEYEDELDYKSNVLQKALDRKRISPELMNIIKDDLNGWHPLDQDSKMPIAVKYMNTSSEVKSFATKDSIEKLFDVLAEYLRNQESDDVKFLADNIEVFLNMDSCDWEFLRLIQELDQTEMEALRNFLKEIAILDKQDWKYAECMKLREAEDKKGEIHTFDECVSRIKENLERYSKVDNLKYIALNQVLKMLPYIFYMDLNDWEMLAYFSLLTNWDNRKEFYTRKKWGINFVRGMIYDYKII